MIRDLVSRLIMDSCLQMQTLWLLQYPFNDPCMKQWYRHNVSEISQVTRFRRTIRGALVERRFSATTEKMSVENIHKIQYSRLVGNKKS